MISSVPAYIWCMLVLPSTLFAIIALLRRTHLWMLILSFSFAAAAASVAESFYAVAVMHRFDAKFAQAPEVALELDLLGDAIITLSGILLFGLTLALSKRGGFHSISLGVIVAAILSGTYVIVPEVIYAFVRTSANFFRAWILLFPIIAARLTILAVRLQGSSSA